MIPEVHKAKTIHKSFIPTILVLSLILSIGLLSYSKIITVLGFKVFIPELILLALTLYGISSLLTSRSKIEIKPLSGALIILALMSLSSILSPEPKVSFKEALRWGEIFVAFLFTLNLIRNMAEIKVILITILLTGILQALWGILTLIRFNPYEGTLVTEYFTNPNQLARYLDFSLPMIPALFLILRSGWIRILCTLSFLFIGYCLYLTQSRGSWVSNAIVLILWCFPLLYRRTGHESILRVLKRIISFSFKGAIILFFCLLFLVILAPNFSERAVKHSEPFLGSGLTTRLYLYIAGFKIIEDFPLTGVGGNRYNQVALYYFPPSVSETFIENMKMSHVHNLYLKIALENGLLTLMAFLFFLYLVGRDILSSLPALKGERYWLLVGMGGGVLAWLLHNLVEVGTLHFLGVQWGLILGLAISLSRRETSEQKGESDSSEVSD